MCSIQDQNITWNSSIQELYGNKINKSCQELIDAGHKRLIDLLWIFPLRINDAPTILPFSEAKEGMLFKGQGKIISIQARPNFWSKGKRGALLHNITVHIQDLHSNETLTVKWFNSYSSIKKKLESLNESGVEFFGTVSLFQGKKQLTNPEISSLDLLKTNHKANESSEANENNELIIKYPTINGVNGSNVQKIINKIPSALWDNIDESLPKEIISKYNLPTLAESFKIIHGRDNWSPENEQRARERIIYQEFYDEQLKIYLRRQISKKAITREIKITNEQLENLKSYLPFSLTKDQNVALNDIRNDLQSKAPMMRMIQGDVGCGKTAIAILSALIVLKNNGQVAMMCPTESLALQHFNEVNEIITKIGSRLALLLGSSSRKEKLQIQADLINGKIDFVIGTHSLIQETVQFKNLQLAIIDEQHKFGVKQRIKLSEKGEATHTLIMTATPIPRSLSLTQYGDLDITTIREMPQGRKGQKTRIINPDNYDQFLSFLKTRLSMNEQAYMVVPAIEENEEQDIKTLESVYKQFKKYFPEYEIRAIHGKLKADEKANAFLDFKSHKIDLLIATSVIEVGINVVNATIMAILSPERFGLSSLHQLRGRVGRGNKPGFCFLVNERPISIDSLNRLNIIESNTDGFIIAEEDLKIRGEGDIFGIGQSGSVTSRKLASIIHHNDILNKVRKDVQELISINSPLIINRLHELSSDPLILSTI